MEVVGAFDRQEAIKELADARDEPVDGPRGLFALVTGAAAGIDAACARRLARNGFALGVLDLDAERCAQTAAEIVAAGVKASRLERTSPILRKLQRH